MSTLEAKLRAQMLDGNAALLSLADDGEEESCSCRCCTHAANFGHACDSLSLWPCTCMTRAPLMQVDDLDDSMEASSAATAAGSGVTAMPEEVQLPKIRVVVRKRPLNSKVGARPPLTAHC